VSDSWDQRARQKDERQRYQIGDEYQRLDPIRTNASGAVDWYKPIPSRLTITHRYKDATTPVTNVAPRAKENDQHDRYLQHSRPPLRRARCLKSRVPVTGVMSTFSRTPKLMSFGSATPWKAVRVKNRERHDEAWREKTASSYLWEN